MPERWYAAMRMSPDGKPLSDPMYVDSDRSYVDKVIVHLNQITLEQGGPGANLCRMVVVTLAEPEGDGDGG